MTLSECYAAFGGDYEGVLKRLLSQNLVSKFLLKFPADGSFALLQSSLNCGDAGEAFRAAHTLKGLCQNLGLGRLEKSASALTELLRGGSTEGYEPLFEAVREDYKITVSAIEKYSESL